jgi:predicted O-methyltransferase YrrM
MLLCPIPRTDLLHLLPKGGEVAEIGVAAGDFSAIILAHAKPRRLHLIDPWEHQDRIDYQHDGNNVSDDEQERRCHAVATRFAVEIARGEVVLHRAYSQDAAATFEPGQFDWIYIDGLHSYDGVTSDLQHYKKKVKPGGLILGHDYTNHIRAQQMQFGVVEAVNEFIETEGYHLVALTTQEMFPTYVLAPDLEGESVQHLMGHLLFHVPGVVEIRDYPMHRVFQHKFVNTGGQLRLLPSF